MSIWESTGLSDVFNDDPNEQSLTPNAERLAQLYEDLSIEADDRAVNQFDNGEASTTAGVAGTVGSLGIGAVVTFGPFVAALVLSGPFVVPAMLYGAGTLATSGGLAAGVGRISQAIGQIIGANTGVFLDRLLTETNQEQVAGLLDDVVRLETEVALQGLAENNNMTTEELLDKIEAKPHLYKETMETLGTWLQEGLHGTISQNGLGKAIDEMEEAAAPELQELYHPTGYGDHDELPQHMITTLKTNLEDRIAELKDELRTDPSVETEKVPVQDLNLGM